MAVLEIEGRRVEVDDAFKSMSPEEQGKVVDEIAASFTQRESLMGQLNRGIANSVGGAVDFLNPFDDDAWEGSALHMGSAKEGLTRGMQAIGAVGTGVDHEPQGFVENFARGAGEALGAAPLVAGAATQVAARVPGAVGQVADDIARTVASRGGIAIEGAAGGVSRAAESGAEAAGLPEWAQTTAAVAAPAVALPAAVGAVKAAGRGVGKVAAITPGARAAGRFVKDVRRGLAPMTEAGARDVASTRLHSLVGGEDRAAELAEGISGRDEFGRTGAQQTGDPNLLGLEDAARAEYPLTRERLEDRAAETQGSVADAARDMGGDVADARDFFRSRLSEYRNSVGARVERVVSGANESIPGNNLSESVSSGRVVASIKAELNDALEEEAQKWAAVPKDAVVSTSQTRQTVSELLETTPRAQRGNIPNALRMFIDEFGETESVAEMHGLYSELRRVARSAMAGSDQNKNTARMANSAAESILEDLGAISADTAAGKAINDARAFSRTVHETFDTGAVGRILKRTLDGDETIPTEAALKRTIGRGGEDALADDQSLRTAAPGAANDIADYLRGRFSNAILNASGEFTPKPAREWLRRNHEVLGRYPELRKQFQTALKGRNAAKTFSERAQARSANGGVIEKFNAKAPDKAIQAIIGADRPAEAAKRLAAAARKDTGGKALAGLKGAFSDHLAEDTARIPAFIGDPQMKQAMRQVFDAKEMRRFQLIGDAVQKANSHVRNVGPVLESPANRMVEMLARYMAVQATAGRGSSAGASLQIANMASGRAKEFLQGLTNDTARQLLVDAVEDPALMRELLLETRGPKLPERTRNKLAPYLVGATSALNED